MPADCGGGGGGGGGGQALVPLTHKHTYLCYTMPAVHAVLPLSLCLNARAHRVSASRERPRTSSLEDLLAGLIVLPMPPLEFFIRTSATVNGK